MNVLDEFKNYKRKFIQNMNEKLKNLKVEEIKFTSTRRKVGYESDSN